MNAHELQAWLIERYGGEKFAPGLARVEQFLAAELAQLKQLAPRIITIAGTNGKGETALSLARMARAAGVDFVLWTSPHLLSVTERLQNRTGEISLQELQQLLVEGEELRLQRSVGLSYYEALWAAFLRWGLRQKAPLWILEVGLGGRLDAVNLVDADIVALTSISRDHQEYLGNSYRSILTEKLGVTRPQKNLVSALELRYLRELVGIRAKQDKFQWEDLFETGALSAQSSFSERNRTLARRVWQKLGYDAVELTGSFPGRGESWSGLGREWVFYGSHNPDGMRKMIQFLRSNSYNGNQKFFHQIWAAFSQRPVGDLRAMVEMLKSLKGAELFITRFDHPKASDGSGWWRHGEGASVRYIHEWTQLFQSSGQENQRVLVVGSYYFVATVQAHLLSLGATRN